MATRFPCPCCGYLTMGEPPPGSLVICPVCGWEDDAVQYDDPSTKKTEFPPPLGEGESYKTFTVVSIDTQNSIVHVLREGQEAGVFRAELPVKIAVNCFFGAVDEMVTSWILSDKERDYHLSSLADVIVDILLKGMETGAQHGS